MTCKNLTRVLSTDKVRPAKKVSINEIPLVRQFAPSLKTFLSSPIKKSILVPACRIPKNYIHLNEFNWKKLYVSQRLDLALPSLSMILHYCIQERWCYQYAKKVSHSYYLFSISVMLKCGQRRIIYSTTTPIKEIVDQSDSSHGFGQKIQYHILEGKNSCTLRTLNILQLMCEREIINTVAKRSR